MRALFCGLMLCAAPAALAQGAPPAEAETPMAPPAETTEAPPAEPTEAPPAETTDAAPAEPAVAPTDTATPPPAEPTVAEPSLEPEPAPAEPSGLEARDTADVAPAGRVTVGVFNPLKVSVTDRLELSAHPLVFFVAPHLNARFALVQDDIRLSGDFGLAVPTFGMRLTKGYLFPSFATSTDDIAWMVVPKLGLSASGGPLDGNVWTAVAEVQLRVPFGQTNVGPLNSFLAPLDLLFAAPLTGVLGRVGGAYDLKLTNRLRLRGEANVYVSGPQGDLVTGGVDVGPLRQLSPWFFTAHLGLDVAVGKLSRFTAGVYFANYDQGQSVVVTAADGYADRVRVRSNNFLPTLDFIWAW